MTKLVSWTLIVALFVSCKTTTFKNSYPTLYVDDDRSTHRVIEEDEITIFQDYKTLPREIYEALPPRFKIAALTDHLIVIRDNTGLIKYSGIRGVSLSSGKHNVMFKKEVKAWMNRGWIEYKIPGYLNFIALIEDLDYDDVMDGEHEEAWGNWVLEYFQNSDELKQLIKQNSELANGIRNAETTLSNLNAQARGLQDAINLSNSNGDRYRRGARLNALDELYFEILLLWVFDGEYVYANDPFRVVYDNNFADVSGSGWSMNSDVQNRTAHVDTVQAYTNFLDRMNHPQNYYTGEMAIRVDALDSPRLASLARSIVHQATLTNPNRAGWLSSDHALGISVDMSMSGMNYDVRQSNPTPEQVANYNTFVRVMNDAGFVRTHDYSVQNERNHFTLASYARKENGIVRPDPNRDIEERRLNLMADYFESFSQAADMAGVNLANQIGQATGNNEDLMNQAAGLAQEIKRKTEEIKNKQEELKRAREYEKKWRKIYEDEQRRRRRDTCFATYYDAEEYSKNEEFQMHYLNNSVKHWDCGPHDDPPGGGRCR